MSSTQYFYSLCKYIVLVECLCSTSFSISSHYTTSFSCEVGLSCFFRELCRRSACLLRFDLLLEVSPIEFDIPSSGYDYIDLANILFHVKVRIERGMESVLEDTVQWDLLMTCFIACFLRWTCQSMAF